jgi:hypothetical protein
MLCSEEHSEAYQQLKQPSDAKRRRDRLIVSVCELEPESAFDLPFHPGFVHKHQLVCSNRERHL